MWQTKPVGLAPGRPGLIYREGNVTLASSALATVPAPRARGLSKVGGTSVMPSDRRADQALGKINRGAGQKYR